MSASTNKTFSEMVDDWILTSSKGAANIMLSAYELVRIGNHNEKQRIDSIATKATNLAEDPANDNTSNDVGSEGEIATKEPQEINPAKNLSGTYLKSITITNFRQFYGENILEFSTDPAAPVTLLLSNDNGSGKTTFLNAICWGLFGELGNPKDENPEILVNYRALDEDNNAKAIVSVDLNINEKRYRVIRSADKDLAEQGKFDVELFLLDENGEPSPGNMQLFKNEFPPIFRRIFFLAGESINAMGTADGGATDLPFKRGIEILLRTDDFKTAIKDLNEVLNHRLLKEPNTAGNQALLNRQKEEKAARDHLLELEAEKTEKENAIEATQLEVNDLSQLVAAGSSEASTMEEYETEKQKIANSWSEITLFNDQCEDLIKRLCGQVFSHLSVKSLDAGVERINLAQSANLVPPRFGKDILEESLDTGRCQLCDHELDSEALKKIKRIAQITRDKKSSVFATSQRNFLENEKIRHENILLDLLDEANSLADDLELNFNAQDPEMDQIHSVLIQARTKLTHNELALKAAETDFKEKYDEVKLQQQNELVGKLLLAKERLEAQKTTLTKITDEKIPAANEAIAAAVKKRAEANQGNEKNERVQRARKYVQDAIKVFQEMSDGLCEKGREDLEREMIKIFGEILPRVPFSAKIEDDFRIVYTMKENNQPAILSTAQKVLGYGSYAAALSKIAPRYTNALETDDIWTSVGGVEAMNISSCPIVLDAPTTSMVKKNEKMFLQKITEILPQIVITSFMQPSDKEAWETIEEKIGKVSMIYVTGPENLDTDLTWMGQRYQASTKNTALDYIQSTIQVLGE